jgi:hypothetical protein
VRNTNGTQDITISGLGTTQGAAIWGSFANNNETARGNAFWSYGAGVSPTNQLALTTRFRTANNMTIGGHHGVDDNIWIRSRPGSNVLDEMANVNSFIPDGLRLNVTTASPSNALISTFMIAGADARATLVKVDTSLAVGGFVDVPIPFEPTAGILFSNNDDLNGVSGHNGYAAQSVGYFSNDRAGTVTQVGQAVAWRMPNAGTSTSYGQVSTVGLPMIDPVVNTAAIDGLFTVSFPNPGTMRVTSVNPTSDASPAEIGIFLMDTGELRTQAGILTLPGTTGEVELTAANFQPDILFRPQAALFALNRLSATDVFSGDSAAAGVWGTSGVTRPESVPAGEAEYSTTVASRWAQTTSDTESLASDRLFYIQPHDGTTTGRVLADFVSFVDGGMTINLTEASGTPFMLPYLVFETETRMVPEPSALVLSSAAMIFLSFSRRRRHE